MKTPRYRIESLSPTSSHRQFTQAANLSACMTECATLLKSSHKILTVYEGSRRMDQAVVINMIVLAGRKIILDWWRSSLDLDLFEAEKLFGGSLSDQETVQRGLQMLHLNLN